MNSNIPFLRKISLLSFKTIPRFLVLKNLALFVSIVENFQFATTGQKLILVFKNFKLKRKPFGCFVEGGEFCC